jgi:curved DNA-binding protein CbpA
LVEPITNDAYAILGVKPESDHATIVAAYRALARRVHPDIAGEAATDRMILVNAAFEQLRTRERRAAYDQSRSGPGGFAERRRSGPDGTGAAGPPPGRPSGSVLTFGRHVGWSIGEIARVDPGYLVWLEERRDGQPFREEIDRMLRAVGYRVEREERSSRGNRGSGR